jgi:hypothetical protein
MFYSALVDVRGWKRLPVTVAAQPVQRSAFPPAYATWELLAAKLVDQQLDANNRDLNRAR